MAMRRGILMYGEEPTDEELAELMHEVAIEAKRKAVIAEEKLKAEIKELVSKLPKKDE